MLWGFSESQTVTNRSSYCADPFYINAWYTDTSNVIPLAIVERLLEKSGSFVIFIAVNSSKHKAGFV